MLILVHILFTYQRILPYLFSNDHFSHTEEFFKLGYIKINLLDKNNELITPKHSQKEHDQQFREHIKTMVRILLSKSTYLYI